MILSDKIINEYINTGKIIIFPEFDEKNIRPAGIRLHLGLGILIPQANQTVDIGSSDDAIFDEKVIGNDGYILKPGEFILGSTYESFQVPRDIVCHIESRSTVARLGIAIHCTSSIIDGNYEEPRTVVLEIKNQGPFSLVLKYKMALAMLFFSELTTDIKQSVQKQYKGQNGTVPPNLKLQKE